MKLGRNSIVLIIFICIICINLIVVYFNKHRECFNKNMYRISHILTNQVVFDGDIFDSGRKIRNRSDLRQYSKEKGVTCGYIRWEQIEKYQIVNGIQKGKGISVYACSDGLVANIPDNI
jgi:predicted small integral membrane protein